MAWVVRSSWALATARGALDLRRGLPRISRNVLSQRLDDLEAAGVLARRTLPPPAATAVYELTERGLELESVLQAIGRWGARSPSLPDNDTVGVDTFVLGLRSRYEPGAGRGRGVTSRYELRVEQEAFEFLVERGRLTVRRGGSPRPDATIVVEPAAMAAVARGEQPVIAALTTSADASQNDLARFAALFGHLDFGAPEQSSESARSTA